MLGKRGGIRLLVAIAVLAPFFFMPQKAQAAPAQVAPAFRLYYAQYSGLRSLGYPIAAGQQQNGVLVQYFEKARLEDHRANNVSAGWGFMYGRLAAELIEGATLRAVNNSSLTYQDLAYYADPGLRQPPPAGFAGGTMSGPDGNTFVPIDSQLGVQPGHYVPGYFWNYMNQRGLFPGGWLHDLGLPLTPALEANVFKEGQQRRIILQAFERNVLTFDPQNPAAWQVERGNLGVDLLQATGQLTGAPEIGGPLPTKWIEVDLSDQWLYAYDGGERVFNAPVSTGKDGFNTPTGTYAIYLKLKKQTMDSSAGGEAWVVPDVPDVMYFNGDVALHGTYWHNRHGTGARLSHGCVNLPLDAATWLYNWAPIGTFVVVHN